MAEVFFTLNGDKETAQTNGGQSLLDFLRLKAGFTGTKQGCESRYCGACTVIINQKARRACAAPLRTLDGATVETIEGLASGGGSTPCRWPFCTTRRCSADFARRA